MLRALARLRIAQTRRRRDDRLRAALGERHATRVRARRPVLDRCFPPRSEWVRLPAHERHRVAATRLPLVTLERTVFRVWRTDATASPPWLTKLRALIEEIRGRALGSGVPIDVEPPRVVPLPRPDGLYRPIALYPLRDRVIASLTARYLLGAFDIDQSPCSFAYRCARSSGRPGEPATNPSHHDAFAHLRALRERFGDGPLWVAECDLHGFFDSLHHDEVMGSFDEAIARARARGISVDPRARRIVEAFLRTYTFLGHALPEVRRWFAERRVAGRLHSCEERLRSHYASLGTSLDIAPVGVAQGSPLGGLLANLVLDAADRAVEATQAYRSEHALYARFCDDMIVCHPTREGCQAMLDAYERAATAKRLFFHRAKPASVYGRSWWQAKSRAPYVWADRRTGPDAVPWVGFVGYQVRWDRAVRIRPSSVRAATRKQAEEVDRVIEHLRRSVGMRRGVAHRLCAWVRRRMIARAVGRLQIEVPPDQLGPCWSAGFRGLLAGSPAGPWLAMDGAPVVERKVSADAGAPIIRSQLRELDRCRERQLRRLREALRELFPRPSRGHHAAASPAQEDKPAQPADGTARPRAEAAAEPCVEPSVQAEDRVESSVSPTRANAEADGLLALGAPFDLLGECVVQTERAPRSRRQRRRALQGYPYSIYGRFFPLQGAASAPGTPEIPNTPSQPELPSTLAPVPPPNAPPRQDGVGGPA